MAAERRDCAAAVALEAAVTESSMAVVLKAVAGRPAELRPAARAPVA